MQSELQGVGLSACPYLGIDVDPSVMLSVPSSAHRCFAVSPAAPPDLEFQARACLQSAHERCPRFQAALAAQATKPTIVRPSSRQRATRRAAERRTRAAYWLVGSVGVLLVAMVTAAALALNTEPDSPAVPVPSVTAGVVSTTASATDTPTPLPPTEAPTEPVVVLLPTVTPHTQVAASEPLVLRPKPGEVGWWQSGTSAQAAIGDSFLNVGQLEGSQYVSAVIIDLASIPRGAPVLAADLALTGLNGDRIAPGVQVQWLVQLVAEQEMKSLATESFEQIVNAPSSVTLPVGGQGEIGVGLVNRWEFDQQAREWIARQRELDARSMTVRVSAQIEGDADMLFAWDSGAGPISVGAGPVLTVQIGAVPPTPPPVPTTDLPVWTMTPTPLNVATVAALQQTATAVAQVVGTYTPPAPYATPTPIAKNVPTAQAIARSLGLPAVVLETPVPQNEATEAAQIAEATFVAFTTGTYTPVPTSYVTPMLVIPSPPAENLATVVARNEAASASLPGPTLPYNAVEAEWVQATPVPQNVATAAAISLQATADAQEFGPETATPWGRVIYTPVPPTVPTATPTTPLIQEETLFTPTPEPLPSPTQPAVLPDDLRNRIIFKSNRLKVEETYAYDPATGSTARINADWAWPLAAQELALSPDGQSQAVVKADSNGILQVFVRSLVYGTDTQITAFRQQGSDTRSYDPAWSPTGEWIAFVSTNSGNDEIYRVSPDGSIVQQLTFNTWEWDKHPTWSPDGTQILFYSNRDTQRRQLWVMNADGSGQHLLLSNDAEDWDPVWTR